jgi:hypothetical protein
VNPSLTIYAWALRVADLITARVRARSPERASAQQPELLSA